MGFWCTTREKTVNFLFKKNPFVYIFGTHTRPYYYSNGKKYLKCYYIRSKFEKLCYKPMNEPIQIKKNLKITLRSCYIVVDLWFMHFVCNRIRFQYQHHSHYAAVQEVAGERGFEKKKSFRLSRLREKVLQVRSEKGTHNCFTPDCPRHHKVVSFRIFLSAATHAESLTNTQGRERKKKL